MRKHIRRGHEFWQRLVDEFEGGAGREQHRAFAERRGVRCHSFQRWLYRLRRERSVGKRRSESRALPWPLVEVRNGPVADAAFEIDLPRGRRLRVPAVFDGETLRRLLAIIDSEPGA